MLIHATSLRRYAALAWSGSRSMTLFAGLMFAWALACGVGLLVDATVVAGAPAYLKPLKFAISGVFYALTLAWMMGHFAAQSRWTPRVGALVVAMFLLEVAVITLQAARGTHSHYNMATPFDSALYTIMAVGIVGLSLGHFLLWVQACRARFEDPVTGTTVRVALLVTLVGMLLGGLMNQPTPEQLALLKAGEVPALLGAHTLGAPDGGPGLAVVGWSTIAGDRRVAHFFGIHALQLLPMLAWLLRRRVRPQRQRRVILASGASYLGLTLILAQQAQRAESLFAPGMVTWGLFLSLMIATILATALLSRGDT